MNEPSAAVPEWKRSVLKTLCESSTALIFFSCVSRFSGVKYHLLIAPAMPQYWMLRNHCTVHTQPKSCAKNMP